MSDSEEEFASADEGQGDTGKGGVGSGKATEVLKATSKDESKKSGGNPVKSIPTGDSVDKERSKEKTKTPSSSAKPEEKPSTKGKGKHSKQKRKQGNKKEAGSGTLGTTASASVIANTETKSVAVVKDNTEVGQQKPSDSQTPEPSSEDTLKNTDDQTNASSTEPADQTGTTESPDPVNANTSGKVEELSSNVSVEEQTIDRGGSGSQNVELEDKDPVPGPDTGQEKTSSGWGGWSSWGSSLVTAATSSVSTFTNQVGEGFTTVLETVETTLGAPLPEQLAKSDQETTEKLTGQEKRMEESDGEGKTAEGEKGVEIAKDDRISAPTKEDSASGSGQGADGGWLSGWGVSNITHLVSDTGKTLVTGGLDVLESIGKKTYDALSEHDPGLKAVMKGDNKPNLSSMLREAKEQADERSRQEEEYEQSRQAHFGAMFDEYQGLVNLEALEMLSNQSETKVQSLLAGVQSEEREQLKKDLVKIKEAFELEELEDDDDDIEHDFSKLITDHLSEFHRGTSPAKLNAVQAKIRGWLSNFYSEAEGTTTDPKEIHKVCIQSLAELTAKTVEQYHKAGELLLLQTDGGRDMLTRASALASVTRVVCTEVGILSTKFTKCLNKVAEDVENTDSINTYITNVYLEASNSSTYIQDAFQLLLPVLQQASVQEGQAKS